MKFPIEKLPRLTTNSDTRHKKLHSQHSDVFFSNIKNLLWKWTPYNYEQSLYFPNNLSNLSLLNMNNRLLIISFLNENSYKDYLDIDFWNYKKILESFDRNNIKNLEKSFYKAFILSKNNQKINLELRKYFIQNYSKFSNEYKNKILKNFFN